MLVLRTSFRQQSIREGSCIALHGFSGCGLKCEYEQHTTFSLTLTNPTNPLILTNPTTNPTIKTD